MAVTLFHAELLAGGKQLVLLVTPAEDVDIAQSTSLEVGAHVGVPLLLHAWQFLEFVADQAVPLLTPWLQSLSLDG